MVAPTCPSLQDEQLSGFRSSDGFPYLSRSHDATMTSSAVTIGIVSVDEKSGATELFRPAHRCEVERQFSKADVVERSMNSITTPRNRTSSFNSLRLRLVDVRRLTRVAGPERLFRFAILEGKTPGSLLINDLYHGVVSDNLPRMFRWQTPSSRT